MMWHDFERNEQTAEPLPETKQSIAHPILLMLYKN